MPDGVVEWFDTFTGEADITVNGRHVRARATDMEPVARRAGARVHLDLLRDGGVERAVDVRLRAGTRVSHLQGRFGDLTGARRPDTAGEAPYAHTHPGLPRTAATHPLEVARSWARNLVTGDLDGALLLYAPDAVLHVGGDHVSGARALRTALAASPVLGSGRLAEIRGEEGYALVTWDELGDEEPGWAVRSKIEHALIAEQWTVEVPTPAVLEREGAVAIVVATAGDVGEADRTYACAKVRAVIAGVDEPVLFARLRLSHEQHASVTRPAVAQALLDVNGDAVRAYVASHTLREAADLLEERLRDKLQHRAQRRLALRRRPQAGGPGEWRHADRPADRPEHFPRPPDERQLVRHKTFAVGALAPDEAVLDMDQLDFDFHLFSDLSSGVDCLVARRPDGSVLLSSVEPAAVQPGPSVSHLEVSDLPAPVLTVDDALERLNAGGEPFVFFANASTGRGNVVYLRYDGHYGLIAPA